jgi:hypothetical protein
VDAGYVTSWSDCDDSTTAMGPAASETCNYLDDDCDGAYYRGWRVPGTAASWTIPHLAPADRLGASLAAIPDFDGDGDDELAVTAPNLGNGVVVVPRANLRQGAYDLNVDFGDDTYAWRARITRLTPAWFSFNLPVG